MVGCHVRGYGSLMGTSAVSHDMDDLYVCTCIRCMNHLAYLHNRRGPLQRHFLMYVFTWPITVGLPATVHFGLLNTALHPHRVKRIRTSQLFRVVCLNAYVRPFASDAGYARGDEWQCCNTSYS